MSKGRKVTSNTTVVQQKKIKVLAYCDSPTSATGFSTVSRNIFEGLYKTGRYDIDILGINFWGDPYSLPYRIWPTGINSDRDPYGRKKVFGMIPQMEFDILFFLQDTFILDFLPELHKTLAAKDKKFRSIVYYPIDGEPKEQWIRNIDACDVTVAYSQFGADQSKKMLPEAKDPLVIPHGANTTDYFPIDDKEAVAGFRKQYFGSLADKFIITNVNRNQQRKDIPRAIAAFAEFRKRVPESILYLHMAKKDQGWDLPEVVKAYGLDTSKDVIFPENFGPNQGYPRNIVNLIYNASDLVISTTLGEGFGLAWLEAMATKTPIIMPANTMLGEFITEDIGWLCKSGTNPGLYTVIPNDNEIIRPLVDTEDLANKMFEVYSNPEEVKRRTENAYTWIKMKMDWQNSIVPQWVNLFDSVYNNLTAGPKQSKEVEYATEKVIEAEEF